MTRPRSFHVVLDTNILVSGLNFTGRERELMTLAREGAYQLYLSLFILNELYGVLTRKFGWDATQARLAIDLLGRAATIAEPSVRLSVVKRNDADNRVLECAVATGADYLVTGDRRDLLPIGEYEGVKIVGSATFLGVLFAGRESEP
ncbi:MAG TPA: putative toxin-antitoxin system toxin component, PIN family [Dehalococcoidia bacterium]|nr:putative toxin-antitoxin system toxin component, PIN family [Dehalococcoidia bacterium]